MMNEQDRLKAIEHLENALEELGRYPVLSIDIADVGDHFDEQEDGDRGGLMPEQIRLIAERAASDLSENEMGVLPVSDAIRAARKDIRPDLSRPYRYSLDSYTDEPVPACFNPVTVEQLGPVLEGEFDGRRFRRPRAGDDAWVFDPQAKECWRRGYVHSVAHVPIDKTSQEMQMLERLTGGEFPRSEVPIVFQTSFYVEGRCDRPIPDQQLKGAFEVGAIPIGDAT